MTGPEFTATGTSPTSMEGLTRYKAPEQIAPTRFGEVPGDDPLKASDVHSFAMAAYEVRTPPPPRMCAWLTTPQHHQVLTRTKPFADAIKDADLTARIVSEDRPPRPTGGIPYPSLPESTWDLMDSCWKLNPSSRLKIDEVCDRLKSLAGRDVAATEGNGLSPNSSVNLSSIITPRYSIPDEARASSTPI